MTLLQHFVLFVSSILFATSELVIDVQPNVISAEITAQLVINCSINNNEVQHLDVIRSLTLSRYNETLKEFFDLITLEAKTLNLSQLVQLHHAQISFGNLYISLTLHNPTQFDAKVYRCKAEGDKTNAANSSIVAKKEVEYRTNTTALIEEIRRLKVVEKNDQCTLEKKELTASHQKTKLHFVGSSKIIKELIEPLTLTCSLQNQDHNSTVQFMYILHEPNDVIATINKYQPVVRTKQESNFNMAKGELSDIKLQASYIEVSWSYIKLSESGKYFCGAHVIGPDGKSERLNEVLEIIVSNPTFDDLVKVIPKLLRQADKEKEKILENKLNIYHIKEDINSKQQNIISIKDGLDTNRQNINIIKDNLEISRQNIKNITDDLNANKQNIASHNDELNTLRESVNSLETQLANFSTALRQIKEDIENGPPISCRQINSFQARVIVKLISGLKVMCDTKTDGGGWIILQRRINGKVDFYRDWKEYRDGFGDYNIGEFYLGNENIFSLTSTEQYDLRIDLEFNNTKYFVQYENFKVSSESEKYKLQTGKYSGNAGDSLSYHNYMYFSTFDRDSDNYGPTHCAEYCSGAWWYKDCHYSNLNGQWGRTSDLQGMSWYYLTGHYNSVTFSEMKIREREKNYFH
ncbi:BpFREP12.10 [Biomphalaria pfeifferi]|uniref:BpFREP12.10 n=1 Tax=Biomphalaria pfeifferi TaxID=112525 RepID=A0AAD8C3Q4_BIOPF|nr:BpFREP12.10 [Biomphalaria pfeifferi]